MVALGALLKGKLFYLLFIGVATVVTVTTVVTVAVIRKPEDLQTTTLTTTTVTESTTTIESEEGSGDNGSKEEGFMGSSRLSKLLSVNTFTTSEEFKDHEDLISEGFIRIRQ